VVYLGRKVTAFSDLTGAEVPEDQLGKLVVRSHPNLILQPEIVILLVRGCSDAVEPPADQGGHR
jgi:hypothetical protein